MRSITVRIPKARRILDFGCGTGWFLAEAQVDGEPFRVGVDYAYESLRGLNGVPTLPAGQVNPVRLVSADGLHLPFAAASFDAIVGHVSMPYMNTRAALAEVYRILAPGGSLLLTFHSSYYLWDRFRQSLLAGRWKDVIFSFYLGCNGFLNHFDFPQSQVWWKRQSFETVNTQRGVRLAAERTGFTRIATEQHRKRMIFFQLTAQKPGDPVTAIPPPEAAYPLKRT